MLLGELTDLLSHELDRNEDPELTQYVALTLGAFQTLDAKNGERANRRPACSLGQSPGSQI